MNRVLLTAAMAAVICANVADAQSSKLKVGDPAPALGVLSWIKGNSISQFRPGQVYVVEFWATWCPPCNRMMPVLSALQRKYAGSVTVIGIDARETERSDGSIDFVKAFVAKKGDAMGYTVAMDDPEKHPAFDAWMGAGGSFGIPTTFIVDKGGRLVWVGHPNGDTEPAFDAALEQALQGTSDLGAAKKLQQQVNRETDKRKLEQPMWDAVRRRDYTAVLAEADRLKTREPGSDPQLFTVRLGALLHINENEALAYAGRKLRDPAYRPDGQDDLQYWGSVGVVIARQDGLSAGTYRFAATYLEKLTVAQPLDCWSWASLAQAYKQVGSLQKAIAAQQRAMDLATERRLPEDQLQRFRNNLAAYQASKG
jgi:thiol-disulfide isomerase/thioredoxin